MSTTLEQDKDLPAERYPLPGGTNPGFAEERPRFQRTSTGTTDPSSLASWERLTVVMARKKWINTPSRWINQGTGSNPVFLILTEARSEQVQPAPISPGPSLQEQIALIRSSLSLQVKEIARAVGVERPTVYSWINDERTPHPRNRERLRCLYALARHWNRFCGLPLGKGLHEPDPEGKTIFDYLSEDPIPMEDLKERLKAAAASVRRSAAASPTSLRAVAEKHGIDLRHVNERYDDVDLETGTPFSPE